jgi:hypothetical protein
MKNSQQNNCQALLLHPLHLLPFGSLEQQRPIEHDFLNSVLANRAVL